MHDRQPIDKQARARVEGASHHPRFAAIYDAYRPQVPLIVVDILTQVAGIPRPTLVVDLGCGTGISTRVWADYADAVIGIEPSHDMRQHAENHPDTPANVSYRDGFGHRTGLPDECAQIVTCSASLHWMEPEPTFAEVARILQDGGVFAAYDPLSLPAAYWEVDQAIQKAIEASKSIRTPGAEPLSEELKRRWPRDGHLERMKASGHFRFVREVCFHNQEQRDVKALVNLQKSLHGVNRLLTAGNPEQIALLKDLEAKLESIMGDESIPVFYGYAMWYGIH